eukprot:987312-Prymnesium_polylepis.1
MSVRFPELGEETLAAAVGDASAILDGELCACDPTTGAVLPFQTLAGRARKAPTAEQVEAVPVCLYVFDLLHYDGRSLLGVPLAERRALLRAHVMPLPGRLAFADGEEVHSATELSAALDAVGDVGGEGLMCKALRGPTGCYDAGKRSLHWLKLKRDYVAGLGDSLDLVPIAGYMGEGKRKGAFGA